MSPRIVNVLRRSPGLQIAVAFAGTLLAMVLVGSLMAVGWKGLQTVWYGALLAR